MWLLLLVILYRLSSTATRRWKAAQEAAPVAEVGELSLQEKPTEEVRASAAESTSTHMGAASDQHRC